MIKPSPPKPSGISGLLLLLLVAVGAAGFAFDVFGANLAQIGVASQPGARAVLGVGVTAVIVLAAHVLRFALGRKLERDPAKGGASGDHT